MSRYSYYETAAKVVRPDNAQYIIRADFSILQWGAGVISLLLYSAKDETALMSGGVIST